MKFLIRRLIFETLCGVCRPRSQEKLGLLFNKLTCSLSKANKSLETFMVIGDLKLERIENWKNLRNFAVFSIIQIQIQIQFNFP